MYRTGVLWIGLLLGLTGCLGSQKDQVQGRSQIGEDPAADPDAFATVGMKTMPDNMGPIAVSGVGLVYGLQPGTGSGAPPGSWRQMLEQSLKKQGLTNLKEILDDPNRTTSLVLVSALIPPGARKGEIIDVQISLPDESKTTSLKGGKLLACELVNYETSGNIDAMVKNGQGTGPSGRLLLGSAWAKAEGPVVAGLYVAPGSESDERAPSGLPEPVSLRAGRIWGGGRVTRPRPYFFLMKPGDQNIRTAANVAERLNATFHGTVEPELKVAEAKTRDLVLIHVPYSYRHNHYRFLLVSRQVPMVPIAPDSLYRRKLEEELLDPATTLAAAIKLEALGGDSRRALRLGLESPSPWVRFASAAALAYLGHTDGANELARLAEDHPALRAHCLKALAANDDAAFTDRLADLTASVDPELRYGAFIALRLADENNPTIRGHLLSHGVWLHRVAPGSPGLIHMTSERRSEIVLFGDGVKLKGPFTLPVGSEFTVSMSEDESEVKIGRIVQGETGPEIRDIKCPPDLHVVIGGMARLGAGHSEIVELIRRASAAQVLTAAVAVDAIPRQFSVQQLATFARTDPTLAKANVEVARVGTIRTDLEAVGVDLPQPEPEVKIVEPPPRPPLSRQPGRLFGPKRSPEPEVEDPLTPVIQVEAEEPAEKPTAEKALSRNPGTLFPRK
jgi:hypothetical protein